MKNHFGISQNSYTLILEEIQKYPQIEEVLIFGSRAKGTFRNGSDIDLAIKGKDCSPELALKISGTLNNELPIPYYIDVLDYDSLQNAELKQHINRVGLQFYSQKHLK